LSALLLPALSRAKSKADLAVCGSNLRQIQLGLSLYLADEHSYPGAITRSPFLPLMDYVRATWPMDNLSALPSGGNVSQSTYLGPVQSVWACPGYNRASGAFLGQWADFGAACSSYGYNYWGQCRDASGRQFIIAPDSAMPSQMIHLLLNQISCLFARNRSWFQAT
jgi:hypothetical protein